MSRSVTAWRHEQLAASGFPLPLAAAVASDPGSGADADAAIPGLRAHLAGCLACREEHESLRALVAGGTD